MESDVLLSPIRLDELELLIKSSVRSVLSEIKTAPPASGADDDVVKIEVAAQITGYKKSYLYELVNKDAIPFFKVGSSLRFSRRELISWITAGRPPIHQAAIDSLADNFIVNKRKSAN